MVDKMIYISTSSAKGYRVIGREKNKHIFIYVSRGKGGLG
jgi:hypothetical protein